MYPKRGDVGRVNFTPIDLLEIDPTGRGRATISRFRDTEATPVPAAFGSNADRSHFLADYLGARDRALRGHHPKFQEWDDRHVSKFAPQGGNYSLEKMQIQLREFYTNAAFRPSWTPSLIAGRDYLIRWIKQLAERDGYPSFYWDDMGVTGTSAGLPTMCKKGEFYAESINMTHWRHVFWDLPGQRRQRTKDRPIHQDATSNVRYIEPILAGVRVWLRNHLRYFGSWRNPTEVTLPAITRALAHGDSCMCVNTDYNACDAHYSLDVATEIVLPVYETLINDNMVFLQFASFVEELFHQPLFWGDYGWIGQHNLFSGQAITNDFETIFDVINALGALLSAGMTPYWHEILAMGDDVAVLVPDKAPRRVLDIMVENSNSAGLVISTEKSGIIQGSVEFCRKLYYPALPKDPNGNVLGAYPTVLCWNNLVNPERHADSAQVFWISFLQRLDGALGTPWFSQFVVWAFKQARLPHPPTDELERTPAPVDWWTRVYGTPWTLKDSPSYAVLVANKLWK